MKILVVGGGGREHALAWRLAQGRRVQKVYVAPGNAGTALEDGVENLPISGIPELLAFAQKEDIHFTVVGPEAPLAAGIVDTFRVGDAGVSAKEGVLNARGVRRSRPVAEEVVAAPLRRERHDWSARDR